MRTLDDIPWLLLCTDFIYSRRYRVRRATPVASGWVNKCRGRRNPPSLWPAEAVKRSLEGLRSGERQSLSLTTPIPSTLCVWMFLRDVALQTPSKLDKAVLQGTGPAQKAKNRLGLERGRDTPRDQEDDHRERDPDRNFRPQLIAIHQDLKCKCCEK